jgi:superfamily II DNA or RNA helicase
MQLRTYQIKLINDLKESLAKGNKNIMVQSPAGSGKSVTMAEIARRATKKKKFVLFIVHRHELVDQIKKTFELQNVDFSFCYIAMVQTVTRHLDKINYPRLILVDEAHHSLAKSYIRIFKYFSKANVIGFTATPWRLSGKGFTDIYNDLILGPSIKWLIKNHYLAPFNYYSAKLIDTNLLKKSSTGDYTHKSMEKAGEKIIYGDIVKSYKKFANNTKAIVYTYNVASAKRVAQEFNQAEIKAKEVDGKTDKEIRKKIMTSFRNGKIQILVNAELYGEGIDVPDCETVIMLRPTESLSLFIQQSMRAMRYQPGKHAVIIDQVANYLKFGLPDQDRNWTLQDREKHPRKESTPDGIMIKTCPDCFAVIAAGCIKCPLCGHDFSAEIKRLEQKKEQKLQEIKSEELERRRIANKSVNDLRSFKELAIYGSARNFKPGWAWHMAKKKGFIK